MEKELYLVIHDVRSAHNVGSLFRTADATGVSRLFLTGYTPAPLDRFGRNNPKLSKVSLGAEDLVPWEKRDIVELIEKLHREHVDVLALEQAPGAVMLSSYVPKGPIALIVGNEVGGISDDILARCDAVVEIPMRGKKESLNVSNAGAIALFALSQERAS